MRQPKLKHCWQVARCFLFWTEWRPWQYWYYATYCRCCRHWWFGAFKGCADIYAPKTVRSSMGSLFHIPVLSGVSEQEFVSAAKKAGYDLLVTCLDGADNLYKADLSGRIAFVMGNEAGGVSETLLEKADKRVYIPMAGRAESLNVAMAAGIVMFEAFRRKVK